MKKYIALLLVIAIAVATTLIITGQDDDNPKPSSTNTQNTPSQQTPAPGSNNVNEKQVSSSTDKISILNFSFIPLTIEVKKGTKVTWTNNDNVAHNIAADSQNGPKSDNLGNGQTFSFTFKQVGTFDYICGIHPSMRGSVIVSE